MSYEFFVSIRHLSAKKSQKFISLNTWISMAGVGLGVMALIVVIAVMSGFGKDLRDKILGTNSHVVVTNVNRTMVEDYQNILEQVRGVDGVTAAAPFIMNQVMLIHGDRVSGIVVRGIDPGAKGTVSDLAKNMIAGTVLDLKNEPRLIKDGKPVGKIKRDGLILGKELSRRMGVVKGDVVSMVSPVSRITPVGLIPRMKLFKVVGVFESGMYEYDANLSFISLESAQKFFSMKDGVSGIEIRVSDIEQAGVIASVLQEKLGFPFFVRDWMRMNKNLFSALQLEKVVMFIILILIIFVAAFNIISTLFMLVMEKTKEIAVLKSMGASRGSIMKIFSYQGLVIGVVGTLLGCAAGFTIVPNLNEIVGFIESLFGIVAFPSDVYYLDRLPSEIQYMDSFLIIIFSIVICFVASLYPAWRASRLDPVDGLRYE
ncbi:MAG: lipoprotein-releasing ABC transporter permease subunit [Nitrospinaceae bacterium]|jgi:lipoprotein-releasing system permease protein|nr:lipoprotein-releasing ABC transporter permease subunit [Nitrospinaceae bacterium]MDP6711162.1 lipoprotein-releasing ABC transporter permease subunit [Nitrospinaceae bacterium]MDP7057193.1 lipoprotein-releasing ABC transporter permease subunit [Nitrospinaceae bacterium]HAK38171.1 lipoprotein-releasing ABC transporter permease subunit [Nitrospina sp.]|tara:strand:- start:2864 stop:4150 length:1287 start_codon:yes stop_codon:yes gene_type:complete